MPAGTKTPPEVEDRVVQLVRDGLTAGKISRQVGIAASTVLAIAKRRGVQFAAVPEGQPGWTGSAAALAKARGVQSEYARNRRAMIADRILDSATRTLDLLDKTTDRREYALLSQALSHHSKAYAEVTLNDSKAAPDMTLIVSTFDTLTANMIAWADQAPDPRPGLIQS